MSMLVNIWKFATPTKALDHCSGQYERLFYESLYRVTYLAGISSADKGFGYLLYSYSIKILMGVFLCGELWDICSSSPSLDVIVDKLTATLIHIIAIYRYIVMLANPNTFNKLRCAMETDMFDATTPRRKELIQHWYRTSEAYMKILLAIGTCTLAAWYLYPLVDDLDYNLAVAVRVPIDYKDPVRYPIVYLLVIIAFHYISYFVMVNDLIMQVTLIHILCQYSVLADCFESIIEDCSDGIENDKMYLSVEWQNRYLKRLNRLIDQHKFIMENTMELRKILSIPMLFQFASSGMIICCAAYQMTVAIKISTTKFLMTILYLSYSMCELFVFCRWCDEIRVQSEGIRDAVYISGWERGAARVYGARGRLLFLLTRAGKPIVLSAGGLYDLSLQSFGTVVKTSYTALTVLLRFREE